MPLVVVCDACALYPMGLRDLLIRLAIAGVVRVRWTAQILDEVFRALAREKPDLPPEKLARSRTMMEGAVRDAMVTGYEPLIDTLALPDPDDRHVVAAAIHCGAQAIVTYNMKHFRERDLRPHGIEPMTPDVLLLNLLEIDAAAVANVVRAQADALKNPPMRVDEVLTALMHRGLVHAMLQLRVHFAREDLADPDYPRRGDEVPEQVEIDVIAGYVRLGLSEEDAAALLHIDSAKLAEWMSKGEDGPFECQALVAAIKAATADFEANSIRAIEQAARDGDVDAQDWLAERARGVASFLAEHAQKPKAQ